MDRKSVSSTNIPSSRLKCFIYGNPLGVRYLWITTQVTKAKVIGVR